jgi:pyruvate,orthophosphate dikinase
MSSIGTSTFTTPDTFPKTGKLIGARDGFASTEIINSARQLHFHRFGGAEAEGSGSTLSLLGGKGAALVEMTRLGIPVPPGFTIDTEVCRIFLKDGKAPHWFAADLAQALRWLEKTQGQTFGGDRDPLLVSVRSGAAISMPGMMDTVLNVGLNDENVIGLADRHGSLRFALDSYRRLLQMFGSVVLGVPKKHFDCALDSVKDECMIGCDAELDEVGLEIAIQRFKQAIQSYAGRPFPMDPREQLDMAVCAVFDSWKNDRARHYRRIHNISDDLGTAVTVQSMVFGNYGNSSGTGVGFTRNPSTGEHVLFGEFLANAQGEDIVAGSHTPTPIAELALAMPDIYRQLTEVTSRLERHYADVQDFEFTVQNGKLFLLQTRAAKRSARAAIRTAVEMAQEGLISKAEAIRRVPANAITEILSPQLDLDGLNAQPIARGLAASPSSAAGQVALTADRAVLLAGKNREHPIILVRQETTADDIEGMHASVGFLTARGGATSHAAVVARGMGKCCITGASGIEVDEAAGTVRVGSCVLREQDWISLDGNTGRIFAGKLPLRAPQATEMHLETLLAWTRDMRDAKVRANADTPDDARRARENGAVGIGLCRTEHMFFAPDRLPQMRAMVLASSLEERRRSLKALLPMQQADFEEIFRAMAGLPVTIRLIDPPLHEFLPDREEVKEQLVHASSHGASPEEISKLEGLLQRIGQLSEVNPMMGHRGCRLGITYPEIIAMQVQAILQAALQVESEGVKVEPEIMIPLVSCVEEIRYLRNVVELAADEVFQQRRKVTPYRLGAMIELPRAAVCAASIAREMDFLSFGTNDLTQMTYGFSRDDARKFIDEYLERGILKDDPFVTLDQEGVGALIAMAIREARNAKASIKIGVCGEHAGDPRSIDFFRSVGVDYVSCSPARIPLAQLAMAQASLQTA